MKTKTIRQTVTFKARPREVYDMIMDSRKHQSLSGFTQIGVPPNRYSGHYRGWIEAYWTPMKEIFANGVISGTTRARVAVDTTRRIPTQRFRRKLSRGAR
jgi:hypothetical protein